MKVGVFLPIGSRGWLMSTTSPPTMPTFDLNRAVTQRAEYFGLDFALSMVKLRGHDGPSEFWTHGLDSVTLMAGLAAVTRRIQLFASIAVLTLPPALTARMAVTLDQIAPGRTGINIVTGWLPTEYAQMGLWPGPDYYGTRYDQATEYVRIMKELWSQGRSDFKGRYFQMDDCRLSPPPTAPIPIIGAGQSERGLRFVAEEVDYNFIVTLGLNAIDRVAPAVVRTTAAAQAAGRDVGPFLLLMVIAGETDEEAFSKWEHYKAGVDVEAITWGMNEAAAEANRDGHSTASTTVHRLENPEPTSMLRLIGSYANVAGMLDEIADVPGLRGVMLTFDDFIVGMEQFGERIQPLMRSRVHVAVGA